MAAQFLNKILRTNVLRKRVAKMIKTPEQQHAGLIVFVGRLMAVCFTITIFSFLGGILFVDQPMEQAPTDAQLIDLLSTLLVFLTGTLSGLVASNGLKSKNAQPES
jgi:hypothetical protein